MIHNVLRARWVHSATAAARGCYGGGGGRFDGPGEFLRRRVAELERRRRRRRDPSREEFRVEVPESLGYLDTVTMPMILTGVAIALLAKLLMMYDDSKAQEMLEKRISKLPEGTGSVRMLTREEWDEIQEIRPRTPFESKLARTNARIRTGEPLRADDVKDWTIDVITDALTRVEETAKLSTKGK
ncbi:hypothetical protein QJS10_CPB15g01034 [Acorus calamus]|uniref:Uncharacterized protein n=1 Tax=Acorus calamus TaxID=4465 RepID=A0AAV9D7D2_ACOCL|nr:hypothetical protein QJS10_CPB15g01034 [Acorus calamus]